MRPRTWTLQGSELKTHVLSASRSTIHPCVVEGTASDRSVEREPIRFRQDLALARLCREGDICAQERIVDLLIPVVNGLFRRKGLAADVAEDLCQETLLSVFDALNRYEGKSRLTTWAYTIASRRLADWFRSAKRRDPALCAAERLESETDGFAAADQDPLARLESEASSLRVRQALAQLTEPMKSVLIDYYLGELSVKAIATELGIPVATVKTHLHRGRKALRKILEEKL